MPIKPGTVETPAAAASFFEEILSPIASMAEAGGPMKATPSFSKALANSARSDRNP